MQTSLFSRFKFGLLWCWAVAAAMGMASNAWAQAYPSKPIKFVITHAAGGFLTGLGFQGLGWLWSRISGLHLNKAVLLPTS